MIADDKIYSFGLQVFGSFSLQKCLLIHIMKLRTEAAYVGVR